MGKFEGVEMVGLRYKETEKLLAVYPNKPEGTDEEIEKAVKFWYYQQGCEAEEKMKDAYVDTLTEYEIKLMNKLYK